jgi:hypothetical protein
MMTVRKEPGAMEMWELRKALVGFLQQRGVPQDVAEKLLSQCATALRDSALVEAIARTIGFTLSGFRSDDGLALYYDVAKGDSELGYISKGWDDPGFRIGEILTFPADAIEDFRGRSDVILEICASQLVALGARSNEAELQLDLTIPIYAGGLNAQTFQAVFENLSQCAGRIKEAIQGSG